MDPHAMLFNELKYTRSIVIEKHLGEFTKDVKSTSITKEMQLTIDWLESLIRFNIDQKIPLFCLSPNNIDLSILFNEEINFLFILCSNDCVFSENMIQEYNLYFKKGPELINSLFLKEQV